jgi:hypothetical protein
MENTMIAGLLAGLALALVFVVYLFFRGRALVAFFQGLDESMARVPARMVFLLILGGFAGAALLLGMLSAVVFGMVGSATRFVMIALGAAVLFSVLAMISKTPLTTDKIVWNFAVGGVLGVCVPLFSGI